MYDFIVTGGCGFIGSHFIEILLKRGYRVLNIDKMTYVSWTDIGFEKHPHYTFLKEDISEITNLPKCDVLVNFAAESFVDNSIENSEVFFKSNVSGVHNLLEHIRMKAKFDRPLFVQVSTDEVYGDITEGAFTEKDILKPSNPYSATKAAAEQFVYAYKRTYDIDFVMTRCSNNFGKRQYPEKLIPKTIMCALSHRPMTIHGDGSYIRSWIHVIDHCEAILSLIENKAYNDVYNICSGDEVSNLEVVNLVYEKLGMEPKIQFVENRWGQDLRYAISMDKIYEKTSWKARLKLKDTIEDVIEFYRERYGDETNSQAR